MARSRDISKVLSSNSTLATDAEVAATYQTQAGTGLIKIVPSSVVVGSGTGSSNSLGTVTFSGASSVSLNGIFTSTYKNYRLVFNLDTASTSATITARMRASGTDNSGAIYAQMTTGFTDTNAASNRAQSSATSWTMETVTNQNFFRFSIDTFSPQVATYTIITGGLIADNGVTYVGKSLGLLHQANTAYDGITFIMSAGTFGGTILVYGYKD
jgi:hypothetical protein